MERTARVKVLALLFQLYPRIDQIDDVGSASRSLINTRGIRPASHKPRYF
jgi:hypothetical protein